MKLKWRPREVAIFLYRVLPGLLRREKDCKKDVCKKTYTVAEYKDDKCDSYDDWIDVEVLSDTAADSGEFLVRK